MLFLKGWLLKYLEKETQGSDDTEVEGKTQKKKIVEKKWLQDFQGYQKSWGKVTYPQSISGNMLGILLKIGLRQQKTQLRVGFKMDVKTLLWQTQE